MVKALVTTALVITQNLTAHSTVERIGLLVCELGPDGSGRS